MSSLIPEYDVVSFSEFMATEIPSESRAPAKRNLQSILDTYSCPRNPDVESFLKNQAIEQYMRRARMTYLVFAVDTEDLVGYFTLALRPFTIPLSVVSNSQRKKLRCCGLHEISHKVMADEAIEDEAPQEEGLYEASAFLIGQLGKKYSKNIMSSIAGSELLDLAFGEIHEIQDRAGGRLVIAEAEDRKPLVQFYERYGFRRFGERLVSSAQSNSSVALIQMFKLIGMSKTA